MVSKKNDPKDIPLWNNVPYGKKLGNNLKTTSDDIEQQVKAIGKFNYNVPISEGHLGMNNRGNVISMATSEEYSNKLDEVIRKYNLRNDVIAKGLKTKTETVSKHRHGKSPITWEMAQKYQTYFIKHHNIMVDSFLLLTARQDDSDLCSPTLQPGKIEIVGQYLQDQYTVELFPSDQKKIYLQSSMYNHFTFKSAQHWGLVGFIYVNKNNDSKAFTGDLETFFVEDYHYWVCLKSPLMRNYVHKSCLGNFTICKVKDTGDIVVGHLYERPKRTRQAPQTYEIIDPLFSVDGGFVNPKIDFSSVELEWATPILSALVNASASGLGIIEEEDDVRMFD